MVQIASGSLVLCVHELERLARAGVDFDEAVARANTFLERTKILFALLVDSDGHRLAKRNQSTDIDYLLNEKRIKPECLLGKIAYLAGIVDEMRSFSLEELIQYANLKALNMKTELRIPDSFVF